jgi:hypothetical protein
LQTFLKKEENEGDENYEETEKEKENEEDRVKREEEKEERAESIKQKQQTPWPLVRERTTD